MLDIGHMQCAARLRNWCSSSFGALYNQLTSIGTLVLPLFHEVGAAFYLLTELYLSRFELHLAALVICYDVVSLLEYQVS